MVVPTHSPKQHVHGVILLDKALGISSNKALSQVKYLLKAKKAGHTGSLDPLATGILPLCFGEATKFASYLLAEHKTYIATAKLGQTTTTLDSEGEITSEADASGITREQILTVLTQFTGDIIQIPPMYSALKVRGTPLYKLARQGKNVARKERSAHIYHLNLINLKHDTLTFEAKVSKGTYIRTLAADIGTSLGCGAHLSALRRTGFGEFSIKDTITFAELSELNNPASVLLTPSHAISSIMPYSLTTAQVQELTFGRAIRYEDNEHTSEITTALTEGTLVKMQFNTTFVGLGLVKEGQIVPKRLINFALFDFA